MEMDSADENKDKDVSDADTELYNERKALVEEEATVAEAVEPASKSVVEPEAQCSEGPVAESTSEQFSESDEAQADEAVTEQAEKTE